MTGSHCIAGTKLISGIVPSYEIRQTDEGAPVAVVELGTGPRIEAADWETLDDLVETLINAAEALRWRQQRHEARRGHADGPLMAVSS